MEAIMRALNALKSNLNSRQSRPTYLYPVTFRLGTDLTNIRNPNPISKYLLDADVIRLMNDAYPNHSLLDLSAIEEVLAKWWSDPDYGRMTIEQYIMPNEPNDNGQEEADADDDSAASESTGNNEGSDGSFDPDSGDDSEECSDDDAEEDEDVASDDGEDSE
jgi:hypothetical protein